MVNQDVVINGLLCFVYNKVDLMTTDCLEKLCIESFTETKIEEAKLLFFNACKKGPNDPYVDGIEYKNRRGENKNSRNIHDIVELFLERGTDVPRFVAEDLNELPPLSMNDIDVTKLLRAVEDLKTKVCVLSSTVNAQQGVISELTSIVQKSSMSAFRAVINPTIENRTDPGSAPPR